MRLNLMSHDAVTVFPLPDKVGGQYWIRSTDASGAEADLIGVEGIDGRWVLKSNRVAAVVDKQNERLREVILEPGCFYDLYVIASGERLMLFSEPSTEDRRRFRKYALPGQGKLTIGRADGADICFRSKFASSEHAELIIDASGVTLVDRGSSNGTFVNGTRTVSAVLRPGDVVYIVGLTIIAGKGFIAVNNPDGLVSVKAETLKGLATQKPEPLPDEPIDESSAGEVFYRSPRFKLDIVPPVFKIDPPPAREVKDDLPMAMVIGPAATMGMASATMAVFAILRVSTGGASLDQAAPTVCMSFFMVLGMVLWPILSRQYDRKRRARREDFRQQEYRSYLDRTRAAIEAEKSRQSRILHQNLVTADDCARRILGRERDLWERSPGQDDFLAVRLGLGEWPLAAEIEAQAPPFALDPDDLAGAMQALADEPRVLHDVPVSLSLRRQRVVGLIGSRDETVALLRDLLVQLVALHSYDEVKCAFIYNRGESAAWDFVRWLPHAWSDDRSARYVATDQDESRELASRLDREFARRQELDDEDLAGVGPHYVVFALDRTLAGRNELVGRILAEERDLGFSLVALYDELKNLPKECRSVVQADGASSRVFDREDTTGQQVAFRPDPPCSSDVTSLAVTLANTRLQSQASAFTLPDVVTFLELLGAGKVEHLNVPTRWRENNPVVSLEAPIGVDSNGDRFKLDLHERAHGPHGLIAGMTGSGKSELIMSLILSLAVNYHPDELAFVLIDYKGGGMANAFADLPHVAGTITNLDGAAVARSLISIRSELKRRQGVFNAAAAKTGISNIDIYRYQSLYRDGEVDEPLPHLLVISDEFAELKTQQPEFMTELVSAARIGRSLGVHLVLATQKPSGIVDDQIWSNSRFRICLKVQEKADSQEVIKRPDAAELAETGRFYVQVGYNEMFALGQSAWAGAPYHPSDRVERPYDFRATLIDRLARPLRDAVRETRHEITKNPSKQVDEVTRHIIQVAREEKARTRPLWLDPIPALVLLEDLRKKYRADEAASAVLDPVVGELDDPANQRQAPLTVPLSAEGNIAVYGSAGAGKTTFVTTLVHSLITTRTPDDVNLYLVDLGAETLTAFRGAPHVGDVVLAHEAEKVDNLVRMLAAELRRRKKAFAESGGDRASHLAKGGEKVPAIVVVVNNFPAFVELYEPREADIARLAREGGKYGIHFVLTAASTLGIRYRVQQSMGRSFALQLNDPAEYSSVVGRTEGVTPSPLPGRGLCRTDAVHEFQTARIAPLGESESDAVRATAARLAEEWTGETAPRIPVLPAVVTPEFVGGATGQVGRGIVPVGVDRVTLDVVTLDISRSVGTLVLSRSNDDPSFLQGLAEVLAAGLGKGAVTVLDPSGSFQPDSSAGYSHVTGDGLGKAVDSLIADLEKRASKPGDRVVCIASSMSGLLAAMSDKQRERLGAALAKIDARSGFSLVMADAAADIKDILYQPWAKKHVASGTGVWVGDGITEQFTLQPAKSSTALYQPVGAGSGYVLVSGRERLVKLLSSALTVTEEDAGE